MIKRGRLGDRGAPGSGIGAGHELSEARLLRETIVRDIEFAPEFLRTILSIVLAFDHLESIIVAHANGDTLTYNLKTLGHVTALRIAQTDPRSRLACIRSL